MMAKNNFKKVVLLLFFVCLGMFILPVVNGLAFRPALVNPNMPSYANIEISEGLLSAIIQVESSNNPRAYNRYTKASGLTQITPIAWRELRKHHPARYKKLNFWKDIYDPQIARQAGEDYLYILQKILKAKHIPVNTENLLAAYVWGPESLHRNGLHNASPCVKRYIAKVKRLARVAE